MEPTYWTIVLVIVGLLVAGAAILGYMWIMLYLLDEDGWQRWLGIAMVILGVAAIIFGTPFLLLL